VTTPTAPRAVLPTKFATAEKHMVVSLSGAEITRILAERRVNLTHEWGVFC
jgi:hypothetical protein